MNIGGDYYLIEFYNEDKFVTEDTLLVYWNDTVKAAERYAERNNIKYTKIKTHFLREQSGDEI